MPAAEVKLSCGQVGCASCAEYLITDLADLSPHTAGVLACSGHVGVLLSHDLAVGDWKPGDRWEVVAIESPVSEAGDAMFDAFLGGYEAVYDQDPKPETVRACYEEWLHRFDPEWEGR